MVCKRLFEITTTARGIVLKQSVVLYSIETGPSGSFINSQAAKAVSFASAELQFAQLRC